MGHPNADRIRDAYDAQAQGDWQRVHASFTDDIVFHVAGKNRFSGDFRGKEEVFDFFKRRNDETGSKVDIEVHSVVADDEHAVALLTLRASREGRNAEWRSAGIYHMRDGKIAEAWGFNEDQSAVDEFWS